MPACWFFHKTAGGAPRRRRALGAARAKRAMTSPRVLEANAAAARAAARVGVAVVDVYAPSALAFDDPLEAGDMRHFGSATTAAVARLMVEAAYPGVLE